MRDVPSAELLARYRRDDAAAAEELFRRYVERLTRLARSRLSRRLARRVDAEDVVLSAYRSFFLLARGGSVTLRQGGDLWRLLVRITLRKVYRSARRHRADCRSVAREEARPGDAALEAAALAREPSPAAAAALADELRCLLAPLSPAQRHIVELHLQGHETEEIAARAGRSARTVRRTLAALAEALDGRLREAAPPAAPAPATGPLLPYADVLLRRQLGEGGMGKVYRALRRSSGAEVAVKIVRKPLRGHPSVLTRFLQEAELLTRLRHPGIVAVHGLGLMPDGGYFLVMDLIAGSDLARRRAAGPVALADALGWVSEAADAMDYAHRQGVVHCDLKPSNLLLDAAGRVHVTDFGLARNLTAGDPLAPGGTAGFMAPEQVDPARGPISPRTDLFGLGAVLYTLLLGLPPSPEGASEGTPQPAAPVLFPPGSGPSDVPPGVLALCRRCLAAAPEQRLGSCAELATALRDLGSSL